jgi:hypothetical protein
MDPTLQKVLGLSDADVKHMQDSLAASQGEVVEDGINIQFHGACPVQGNGFVDGRACYYRSRGGAMSFRVYADGVPCSRDTILDPDWRHDEESPADNGGWEDAATSRTFILRAVALWRAREVPPG